MDAHIETSAAEALPAIALERTTPADTPERLTAHDAAAVLRKLRQQIEQSNQSERATTPGQSRGQAAAPEESDTESTDPRIKSGEAEETASPETETRGETESADPAAEHEDGRERPDAELPPIEPPRSWTKEDKELFTGLPRATQERLAERERSREGDFLRRQNEAADKLKGLDAKEQAVEQARQHYEAALPQLLQTLQQQQAGEFADIKSMADVERLAKEDWPRYLQWDVAQKKMAAVAQELIAAEQRRSQEKFAQFSDFAKRQDDLFKDKVPDMADEGKAAELQKKALSVLSELGFEEAELAQSWNGQKDLSLRDHRVQLLIRDATLWREAQAKAKAAAQKPVPPVQRPGSATVRQGTDEARVQNLTQRLESTGSLRDAAALVRARRAAR